MSNRTSATCVLATSIITIYDISNLVKTTKKGLMQTDVCF